jgi:outer membrane protein OmpA-like peptidoglycan-associated protein
LVELGVSADRIAFATGWGKLYAICSESDESCWSQNRRTHLAPWPRGAENGQVASR